MEDKAQISWNMPSWTEAMYPQKTGLDHLGLASVSQDRILPQLSPGINVLTVHPRYWSVYVWLLTEFWERDLPRTHAAWGRFLKPRERIFIAAVLSCPRHGPGIPEVAGKLQVRREVDEGVAEFDPTAPYLKNTQGGYPIYATAISQLDFTVRDRDVSQFRCDAPTEYGRLVGLTLRDWVAPTKYYKSYFDDPSRAVPADVIAEYTKRICLCRSIDGPDNPYLQNAFLHHGEAADSKRRRASLRMMCDLSSQISPDPVTPWTFRQFIYYRQDDDGHQYQPSTPELIDTARRWRLYQHRELVAWGFNRWLRQVCTWGVDAAGDRTPITLSDVLDSVDAMDFGSLANGLKANDNGLSSASPLSDLLAWVRQEASIVEDLDATWDISSAACEERVLGAIWNLDNFDGETVAGIMTLLATCAARLWPIKFQLSYENDWHIVHAGGRRRLAVDRYLEDMRTHSKQGQTIGQTARWFLEHYVIRQHHRTALGKLPEDTFRLRLDADRILFVPEPIGVIFNDSRFRALSTCAAELGLIRPIGKHGHGPSLQGLQFLKNGDLPHLEPTDVPR